MSPLTVSPPEGAEFVFDEVKTDRGAKSLGDVPILKWNDANAAVDYYGEEGICDVLDGTSLRVSFQSIARRGKIGGKSDDEIAKAQVEFKPGKRAVGASTPVSRAKRTAAKAAEKLGEQGDAVTALLEAVAAGKLSAEDIQALVGASE